MTTKKKSEPSTAQNRPLQCEEISRNVENQLTKRCQARFNTLKPCQGDDLPRVAPCTPVRIGAINPIVSIKWGDSKCDCLETDDVEIMCLTVCNPYSNVTFKDFMIHSVQICDENGRPVPNLPDGTPSVQLVPNGPYCFGDIAPCNGKKMNCVTREFVLYNRGAKPGKYKIKLDGICFEVCFHYDLKQCFELEMCKS